MIETSLCLKEFELTAFFQYLVKDFSTQGKLIHFAVVNKIMAPCFTKIDCGKNVCGLYGY